MGLIIRAKFLLYRHSGVIVTALTLLALVLVWHFHVDLAAGVAAVVAALGLAYFLQKQKLDETLLFHDLFVEFNKRYADLSDDLNKIAEGKVPTEDKEKQLRKYFDLCSEEYLFYCRGYIDPLAWDAWSNGMKVFFGTSTIADFWSKESKTNSYYGFEREIGRLLKSNNPTLSNASQAHPDDPSQVAGKRDPAPRVR